MRTRIRTPAVINIDIEVEWNRQHFQIFTVPGGVIGKHLEIR